MKKRIIILGIVTFALMVVSMASVCADDELTVEDKTEDVYNSLGKIVSRKDIDIRSVTADKTGRDVELKLNLVAGGKIQNSLGVYYNIVLITSINEYDTSFENGICNVTASSPEEVEDVSCSGAGGNTLTISFRLLNSSEDLIELYGNSIDYTLGFFDTTIDFGEPTLNVDIESKNKGKTGESIEFSATVDDGEEPFIWSWEFGDGEMSEEANPSHIFENEGTYNVTVGVLDSNDALGYTYKIIEISGSTNNGGNGGNSNGGSSLFIFIALIAIVVVVGVVVVVVVIRR